MSFHAIASPCLLLLDDLVHVRLLRGVETGKVHDVIDVLRRDEEMCSCTSAVPVVDPCVGSLRRVRSARCRAWRRRPNFRIAHVRRDGISAEEARIILFVIEFDLTRIRVREVRL